MTEPHDDLTFMKSPDLWPQWPQLPVKRARDGKGEFGVLVEVMNGVEPTVYLKNLFMRFTDDTPTLRYGSIEELLADGWKVD